MPNRTQFHGKKWLRLSTLTVVGLAALAWYAPSALACKVFSPPQHVIDLQAQASDTTAPGLPAVTVGKIVRGRGPDTDVASCSQSATSCDDLGSIAVQVSAQDDQTPTETLGYELELAAGTPPSGLNLPTGAIRAQGGYIYLQWGDAATDDQESILFSITVRAVDLAGNVGPASTAQIQDPGSDSGACSVGAHRPLSAWPLTTITILLLARLVRGRGHGVYRRIVDWASRAEPRP